MMQMFLPPDLFILHVDATYKLNQRGYPVVVIGISDRARVFHLVALFIVSLETQPVFEAVFMSLRRLFYYITNQDLVIRNAMGDADQAHYNGPVSVFVTRLGSSF
ncbi:hypothetical protein PC114_g2060 [Phytophthora cactorum]|nr:hypothetical protein PC114_g2060 [Phytophthora cactorum]